MASSTGDGADPGLLRTERALSAFDPDDGADRLHRLMTGLLNYAGAVDHPAMLLARAVQSYAAESAPWDPELPDEAMVEQRYTELAGQVIGALWYLATHMPGGDPMELQAQAHKALSRYIEDEHG